jgi:UDP-glucose 4-epimerase
VIHFAGLKAVGESCQKVGYYHENNVSGSIVLFEIMEKYGVKNMVFSSSATVYKSDNIPPFTEDMPTGTTNPYGTTKLVIEKLIEDYALHL